MKIGIIVALDKEYEHLRSLLSGKEEGFIGNNQIFLHKSGIGKVNSAIKAYEIIHSHPLDCIINTGVAGGLNRSLKSFDAVASSQVVYHDVWCGDGNEYGQIQGLPARFNADSHLLETAKKIGNIHCGLIASGDYFISTREQGDAILAHFPEALAVDMESGSIAQVCQIYGIPFICLRIISDTAGDDHQSEYDNFWETIAEGSFNTVEAFLKAL